MYHLGIIPDGNRRWSKENGMDIDQLLEKITIILLKCLDLDLENIEEETKCFKNIGELSTFVLTKDNLIKRNDETINMIKSGLLIIENHMHLLHRMKIQFVGELKLLPNDIYQLCKSIESKCDENATFKFTVGIAYDPIQDLKRLVNEDETRPKQGNIDLIIRTGGEIRSSGFFPMHTMYSEWFYLEKYFPDITLADFKECICKFEKRHRRFGQ